MRAALQEEKTYEEKYVSKYVQAFRMSLNLEEVVRKLE